MAEPGANRLADRRMCGAGHALSGGPIAWSFEDSLNSC